MPDANSRYKDKPSLRLLECYVLKAIGELTDDDAQLLARMAPKLARDFNAKGTWDEILASILGFPNEMPEKIKQVWQKNQELARRNNEHLYPQDFAVMFVDANFAQCPDLL